MSAADHNPDPAMSFALRSGPIHFGPFLVTSQVFHQTSLSFALVNLKPILPGHVLVSPRRIVPRVTDLTPSETTDLFLTVRRVARMIERVYGASSLNIAIQDGVEAGQSVPHVHTHIIPRRKADLDHRGGTDAVYDMLDGEEGGLEGAYLQHQRQHQQRGDSSMGTAGEKVPPQQQELERRRRSARRTRFPAVDNEERKPRGMKEMEEEARWLASEMEKEPVD